MKKDEMKKITITADKISMEQLKRFCYNRGISMNQFILNATAEKLERSGEHFFWLNHEDGKMKKSN